MATGFGDAAAQSVWFAVNVGSSKFSLRLGGVPSRVGAPLAASGASARLRTDAGVVVVRRRPAVEMPMRSAWFMSWSRLVENGEGVTSHLRSAW